MKTIFISFASKAMYRTLDRIQHEAESMNFFDEIYCCKEKDLDPTFYQKYHHFMQYSRGFGYWIWKPQIIYQYLKLINDGNIIIYCDAGCVLNPQGLPRLKEYVDMVVGDEKGILSFSLDHLEHHWTKSDLFDYFDVRHNPTITDTHQLMATSFIIKKTDYTVKMFEEALSIIENKLYLITDHPSQSPNFNGFIEHRHDQSILSVLRKLVGGVVITDETYPPNQMDKPIWASKMRML